MRVLSVSHTDLDGVGCQIVLHHTFRDLTRMNISYGKIPEYINIIDDYCYNRHPDLVFITDLSFTKEDFIKLYEVTKNHAQIKFYFIDHHPFDLNVEDYRTDNFTIVLTSKASATKLTYLFLKANYNCSKDKKLEEFIGYVNAYDIWLEDTPEFKVGLVYNELFWDFKINYFWNRFSNDFKLRNSDKEKYRDLMKKKVKVFDKLDKSGRIFKLEEHKIFMIFIDDFKNHITLDFAGYNVYAIISSYGGISIRLRGGISDDGTLKDLIISDLIDLDCVDTAGGHNNAFGCNINTNDAQGQVTFAKKLLHIIDGNLDKIKGV